MAAAAQAQAKAQPVSGISRREFLYYVWGASIALYLAEFTGLILWFAIPRIKEGEFGGVFRLNPEEVVPGVNNPPYDNPDGRFWLVNIDTTDPGLTNDLMYKAPDEEVKSGVLALYKVCTHLGCIYSWNASNNRFQCPCHGSKYRLDGRRIESPAPRSTDRFKVTFVDADGETFESEPDEVTGYAPVEMPVGAVEILVDTGDLNDGSAIALLGELSITDSP